MNYWQRRSIPANLIGLVLVALVWWLLELAIDFVLDTAGIRGIGRQRGALLPVLIASLVVTRFYDRMSVAWVGLGFHRWMGRELVVGSFLGLAMATVAWAPGAISGSVMVDVPTTAPIIVQSIMYIVFGAILEELIFRGYPFQRVVEIIGPVAATLLASSLFAIAHLENPSIGPVAFANIFLASVFFSLGYFATGSLWFPIAAHAVWNLTLALILGVPVSGTRIATGWLRTVDGAPAIIGGAAFGPEGGLAATIVLLIGIGVLARTKWATMSPYVYARVFATVHHRARERSAHETESV